MAGLTSTGITIKDVDEILSDIESEQLANIDPDLNVEADSVLGQLNGVFAGALAEVWELLELVYQAAYPDTASGQSLSYIAALTGAIRQPATPSTLLVHLEGTATTSVPAGTTAYVEGDPDSSYATTADATIAEEGDIDYIEVTMEAVTPGSYASAFHQISTTVSDMTFTNASGATIDITSPLNELPAMEVGDRFEISDHSDADNNGEYVVDTVNTSTNDYSCTMYNGTPDNNTAESATILTENDLLIITTPVNGLDRITIKADSDAGEDEETDSDLRFRREQSLAIAGASTVEAIRAEMLKVDGVDSCTVFENPTSVTDSLGLPPKSIEVLVYSETAPAYAAQDVVDEILLRKPAGTETYGGQSGTATDSAGNSYTIYYSEPTTVRTYVTLTLAAATDGTYVGDSEVETGIADWATRNLRVGQSVYASSIINVVADMDGVTSVDISTVKVDDHSSPDATDLILTARQLGTIASVDVTVTST
jgi:uncharacterized phage protein gp47/JayE